MNNTSLVTICIISTMVAMLGTGVALGAAPNLGTSIDMLNSVQKALFGIGVTLGGGGVGIAGFTSSILFQKLKREEELTAKPRVPINFEKFSKN